MPDGDLRDELVTLLVAGHETTATGLAWAFELLLRNPAVLARTRAALAAGDRAYLDAVVKETLRVKPVISGVGRVVRGEPSGSAATRSRSASRSTRRSPPSTAAATAIPPRASSARSASSTTTRPTPTPGCPSAAARAAAWAPASRASRWRVVIRRVLERTQLEPVGRRAEKGVRRGITFTPKRGVRVVLPRQPAPAYPPSDAASRMALAE